MEVSDKRLLRIIHHYVGPMLGELDLSRTNAVDVDKMGHRYVTVFPDTQRK
jgi:hypothetical protein